MDGVPNHNFFFLKALTIKESLILDLGSTKPSDEIFYNSDATCKNLKYDFKFKTVDGSDASSVFTVKDGSVELANPSQAPSQVSYIVDVSAKLSDASETETPYASRKDISIQIMTAPAKGEHIKSRQRRVSYQNKLHFMLRMQEIFLRKIYNF